ncbi:MAG: hypothetical protein CBC47_00450 [Alphaproteobacteria bacterium TMED87]|nr:MAG: hypothetical protein CBC47_00450 [Alphaproteobacteria bacterium TMED87]
MQLFKISRIWSDPLIRNLCSGSLFAITFIWAAIIFFGVDLEIIKTFLLLSFLFVAAMILIGLIFFPLILLLRKQKRVFLRGMKKEPDEKKNWSDKVR